MISATQVRAARALLNWTQSTVVQAVNITPAALSRLESGQTQARARTLQKLEQLFVGAGVEFLPAHGVRLRQRQVAISELAGNNALQDLQNDMFKTTLETKDKLMFLNGINERKFVQADARSLALLQHRMQLNGLRQRILIKHSDSYFVMPPEVAEYRWVSTALFGLIPFVVFGAKVAIIFWGPPMHIVVMESESLAETYRKQFLALWKGAEAVPFSRKEIRDLCEEHLKG